MNILVTGCNGQLGNEILLLEKEYSQHHWFNTDIAELDITNKTDIRTFVKDNNIDGIINCAAYTAVDKAEANVELCIKLNTDAPGYLAEVIEEHQGWLIQISTDYVFDGTKHTPYTEYDATCPNSVYGTTKLAGEQAAKAACQRTIIIRTAWLYSTFGNNFVKTMIRLGREKEALGVVFDQIGTPTYAHDLATAILTMIQHGSATDMLSLAGTYHYSNEGVCSWYDFTKAIHRLAGISGCNVRPIHTAEYPTPASRPPYSVLDKTKIKQALRIAIPHWETSLEECMKTIE